MNPGNTAAKLRVLFGCGGDRDKAKRPRMAQTACQLADHVVITSDNPRTERPADIIRDILTGVPDEARHNVDVDVDRRQAITSIIDSATPGDVVLIAGKGHETYQLLPTAEGAIKRIHFDDREEAARALRDREDSDLADLPPAQSRAEFSK